MTFSRLHAGRWLVSTVVVAAITASACAPAAAPVPTVAPAATKPASAPATSASPAAGASTTGSPVASPAAAKPAGSPAAAAPAAPTEDINALYEAAKTEGQFNWYTSNNTDRGQPLLEKFNRKYPGIKVNYNRQSSEKLEQVMTEEARAGRMTWDVVETNEDSFTKFIKENFLQRYVPSASALFDANLKDKDGMWVSDRVNPVSLSINTSLVKPNEEPKSWDDVTKPEWKGRIAVEEGNVLLYSAMKAEWGAEKTRQFWQGVAANQPQLRSGNTMTAQLLAAGEFGLAVNIYTGEPERLRLDGAPTKVIPVDPVFLQLQLVGLGAKAPNPNAAKLFINWLLSDEGQQGLSEVRLLPARQDFFKKGAEYLGSVRTVAISPEVAGNAPGDLAEFRAAIGIR